MYYGSWEVGDDLTFGCVTHSHTTGSVTAASSPPVYKVYEDDTSTEVATGTLSNSFAGESGVYADKLTLSSTIFDMGKTYTIYISALIGTVTKGFLHTFQVGAKTDVVAFHGDVAVDGLNPAQVLAVLLAAAGGKISGSATNSPVIRSADDNLNRISATTNSYGDRLSVTFDVADHA